MKAKQLKWKEYEGGQHCAETPWRSDFWITKPIAGYGEGMYSATFIDYGRGSWRELAPTLEAAKAACQAHHESKIAALLDCQPNTGIKPRAVGTSA